MNLPRTNEFPFERVSVQTPGACLFSSPNSVNYYRIRRRT